MVTAVAAEAFECFLNFYPKLILEPFCSRYNLVSSAISLTDLLSTYKD